MGRIVSFCIICGRETLGYVMSDTRKTIYVCSFCSNNKYKNDLKKDDEFKEFNMKHSGIRQTIIRYLVYRLVAVPADNIDGIINKIRPLFSDEFPWDGIARFSIKHNIYQHKKRKVIDNIKKGDPNFDFLKKEKKEKVDIKLSKLRNEFIENKIFSIRKVDDVNVLFKDAKLVRLINDSWEVFSAFRRVLNKLFDEFLINDYKSAKELVRIIEKYYRIKNLNEKFLFYQSWENKIQLRKINIKIHKASDLIDKIHSVSDLIFLYKYDDIKQFFIYYNENIEDEGFKLFVKFHNKIKSLIESVNKNNLDKFKEIINDIEYVYYDFSLKDKHTTYRDDFYYFRTILNNKQNINKNKPEIKNINKNILNNEDIPSNNKINHKIPEDIQFIFDNNKVPETKYFKDNLMFFCQIAVKDIEKNWRYGLPDCEWRCVINDKFLNDIGCNFFNAFQDREKIVVNVYFMNDKEYRFLVWPHNKRLDYGWDGYLRTYVLCSLSDIICNRYIPKNRRKYTNKSSASLSRKTRNKNKFIKMGIKVSNNNRKELSVKKSVKYGEPFSVSWHPRRKLKGGNVGSEVRKKALIYGIPWNRWDNEWAGYTFVSPHWRRLNCLSSEKQAEYRKKIVSRLSESFSKTMENMLI